MSGEEIGISEGQSLSRRSFLCSTTTLAMAGGLASGYGAFVIMAGRFLYPPPSSAGSWMFVARRSELEARHTFEYVTPAGLSIVITCHPAENGQTECLALSSICPHLGCRVQWQAHENRFFCPCHNGTFDPQGNPTGGPPAAAGQSLPRYRLRVEGDLLYIEVPTDGITSTATSLEAALPAPHGLKRTKSLT
jgi:Rieske Fe-S protein